MKGQNNSFYLIQQIKELNFELTRLESRVKKMDNHFTSAQNDLNDILITTKKISQKKDKLLKLDDKAS